MQRRRQPDTIRFQPAGVAAMRLFSLFCSPFHLWRINRTMRARRPTHRKTALPRHETFLTIPESHWIDQTNTLARIVARIKQFSINQYCVILVVSSAMTMRDRPSQQSTAQRTAQNKQTSVTSISQVAVSPRQFSLAHVSS